MSHKDGADHINVPDPLSEQRTSNQCDVCGKPAVQWLGDPWGKSDIKRPKCAEHGMRLRDAEDIAEIERLRDRLDLISRLSQRQPTILAVQLAKEALAGVAVETPAERAIAAIAETIRGLTGERREAAVRILHSWNEMMRGLPASPLKANEPTSGDQS